MAEKMSAQKKEPLADDHPTDKSFVSAPVMELLSEVQSLFDSELGDPSALSRRP